MTPKSEHLVDLIFKKLKTYKKKKIFLEKIFSFKFLTSEDERQRDKRQQFFKNKISSFEPRADNTDGSTAGEITNESEGSWDF